MVYKAAIAIRHIILPLTLVDISICLGHAASSAHFVVDELSLVDGSFRPLEDAESIHYELILYPTPDRLVLLEMLTIDRRTLCPFFPIKSSYPLLLFGYQK